MQLPDTYRNCTSHVHFGPVITSLAHYTCERLDHHKDMLGTFGHTCKRASEEVGTLRSSFTEAYSCFFGTQTVALKNPTCSKRP